MVVALLTTKDVAGFTPKATAVAPVKLVPLTVTDVPPALGPVLGLTAVTVATGDPPTVTDITLEWVPSPELL
jgi:hypothetical protein